MNNPEIDKDGNKFWFNDERLLHREDGPAIEWYNGGKVWVYNGEYIEESLNGFTQEDFERFLKIKEYW